jgi:hypothetical protein
MTPRPASLPTSLTSLASLLAIFALTGFVLWKFDWAHPQIKLLSILILTALPIWLNSQPVPLPKVENDRLNKLAVALALAVLLFTMLEFYPKYKFSLTSTPKNDIGQTTLRASHDFWSYGKNPYKREDLNPRPELPAEFRGFHYGPGMLLVFPKIHKSPEGSYRLSLTVWTLILVVSIALLASAMSNGSTWSALSASLFCIAAVSTWENAWREFGAMGVNDPAPLSLMLLSIFMASKNRWGIAGLLLGFSFACKFSPALFALVALARLTTPKNFWIGFLLSAGITVAPFLIASPQESLNNIFLSRLVVAANPTSLYYHIHPQAHLIISAILPITALLVVARNCLTHPTTESIMTTLLIVMSAGILSHREIHANHVLWLVIACAILASRGRYQLFDRILPQKWS